jgi:hypothetical protein
VPWCSACDRFLSPSTVRADGTCPACGRTVEPGRAHAPDAGDPGDVTSAASSPAGPARTDVEAEAEAVAEDGPVPIPWHLWLLLGALAVYLGYRAFQGLEWLFGI